MKDYSFLIKTSDLLNNPGTKDTLVFTNKFSTSLPQLVDKGITVTIDLLGLSDEEVKITFLDLLATFETECDICGQLCRHTVKIKETHSKGAFSEDLQKENIIVMNTKTGLLDVEGFLVETIKVERPVVIKCTNCGKNSDAGTDDFTNEIETTNIIWK